jgi:hypothetical protein
MSTTEATGASEAEILSRVIRPDNGNWSKQAAEAILQFDFPASDVHRMNDLAAKARAGTLASADEAELENYRQVGRLLELMQSKARISLKRLSQPA